MTISLSTTKTPGKAVPTANGELSADWARILEQLIVGVSHNISNRVSTLAGVSDILAGDTSIPPILRALTDEVPRLEEAIRFLRLLAAPNEPEEAVEPLRLVDDAIGLAKLHSALREVVFQVDITDAPPVFTHPVKLTHQIVVLLVTAVERRATSTTEGIRVGIGVEGDELVISAGEQAVRVRTLAAARA